MENTIPKAKFSKVIVPLIAIVAIVLSGYFYSQVLALKKNPQVAAQQETAALVAKVGKLAVLPTGEIPTVATVSDPEALKDQAFFASAQKGDKVLIYAQAKKAFLYSVTLNKILDVAPLNIGASTKATTPAPAKATTTTPAKQ
jgi:hypothetical protein